MTRKFFKPTAFLLFSLLLGFSSCISEGIVPNPEPDSDDLMLTLRISRDRSRSNNGTPSLDMGGLDVHFERGDLYFLDRLDRIIHHIWVDRNATTSSSLEELSSPGAVIKFEDLINKDIEVRLPRNTRRAVIVGNTPGLATSGDISDVREHLLDIGNQFDANNVNIYADAPIVYIPESGGNPSTWRATLHLYPTLARIQIERISGGERIHSFKLQGIFIDGYHRQAQVDGTLDNDHLENSRGTTADNFTGTRPNYLATWYYTSAGVTPGPNGLAVYPAAPASNPDNRTAVWGYNVFAEQPHIQVAAPVVPRIILRLTDVYIINEDGQPEERPGEDHFVTFQGFYSGGPVVRFIAGNVYHFENLTFDLSDLSDKPNTSPREGQVVIITPQWNGNNVAIFGFRQPNPRTAYVEDQQTYTFALAPATYNGSSAGITYQWETAEKDADITQSAMWSAIINNNTTEHFLTTMPIDQTNEGVWFRRIATHTAGGRTIITAGAQVWLSSLPAPRIQTTPGGITSVCGAMTFEISPPENGGWSPAQWNAFSASNIEIFEIRPGSSNGTVIATPPVSRRGDNYYFTLPAPNDDNTEYRITIGGEIFLSGSTQGTGINQRPEGPLVVMLSREQLPLSPVDMSGPTCFDTGHTGPGSPRPHPATFTPVYTLTGVPSDADDVVWTLTVSNPAHVQIANLIPNGESATLELNKDYWDTMAGQGLDVTVTLTAMVVTTGGSTCDRATYTRARTIRIRDQSCCGTAGVPGQFTAPSGHTYLTHEYGVSRCWMVTNSIEQHSSGTRWTAYQGQLAGIRGYYYTQEAARSACPPGWRLPTIAEFDDLRQVLDTMQNNNNADNPRRFWSDPSALAGYRRNPVGPWFHWGTWGRWWSSDIGQHFDASNDGDMYFLSTNVGTGFSVRCIQN